MGARVDCVFDSTSILSHSSLNNRDMESQLSAGESECVCETSLSFLRLFIFVLPKSDNGISPLRRLHDFEILSSQSFLIYLAPFSSMASRPCWYCLSRASGSSSFYSSFSRLRTSATIALFSTSGSALAKVTSATVPQRGARTTFIKKKKASKTDVKAKRPAPGERKAARKRIVLSNTNAIPVSGMPQFSIESLGNEELRGIVLAIPMVPVVDQLRAVEAFKTTQGWKFFRQPGMLVRNETVEYGRLLEELESKKKTLRRVLVGDRGSGKSLMALQAMTVGFLRGWTVINIPEGILLLCSISFLGHWLT